MIAGVSERIFSNWLGILNESQRILIKCQGFRALWHLYPDFFIFFSFFFLFLESFLRLFPSSLWLVFIFLFDSVILLLFWYPSSYTESLIKTDELGGWITTTSSGFRHHRHFIIPVVQNCRRRASWIHQAGYSDNSSSITSPAVYPDILHLMRKQLKKS